MNEKRAGVDFDRALNQFPERLGGICAADLGRLLPVNKKRAGVDFGIALNQFPERLDGEWRRIC